MAPPRDWTWSEDKKKLLSYDFEIVGADLGGVGGFPAQSGKEGE